MTEAEPVRCHRDARSHHRNYNASQLLELSQANALGRKELALPRCMHEDDLTISIEVALLLAAFACLALAFFGKFGP